MAPCLRWKELPLTFQHWNMDPNVGPLDDVNSMFEKKKLDYLHVWKGSSPKSWKVYQHKDSTHIWIGSFLSFTTFGRVSFFNWSCNGGHGRKKTGPKRAYNLTILHTVCITSHHIRCSWNHPKSHVTTWYFEVPLKVIRWGLWFIDTDFKKRTA